MNPSEFNINRSNLEIGSTQHLSPLWTHSCNDSRWYHSWSFHWRQHWTLATWHWENMGSHARRECCSPMWTRHSLEKSSIQLQVVWCLTFLYQKGKGSTCWLIQRTETTTMLELIAHWSSFTIGYGCSYHRLWVYHLSDLSDIQSVLQQVIHRSCAPPWSSCRSWSSVAILGGTLRTGQEGSLKGRTKGIWAGCWLI